MLHLTANMNDVARSEIFADFMRAGFWVEENWHSIPPDFLQAITKKHPEILGNALLMLKDCSRNPDPAR